MEIACIVMSLAMTIIYNVMPIIVATKVKKAGIVNNTEFYADAAVMQVWEIYLCINIAI